MLLNLAGTVPVGAKRKAAAQYPILLSLASQAPRYKHIIILVLYSRSKGLIAEIWHAKESQRRKYIEICAYEICAQQIMVTPKII